MVVEDVLRDRNSGIYIDSNWRLCLSLVRDDRRQCLRVVARLSGVPAVEHLGCEVAAYIERGKLPGPGKDPGDVRIVHDAPEGRIVGGGLLNLVLRGAGSAFPGIVEGVGAVSVAKL